MSASKPKLGGLNILLFVSLICVLVSFTSGESGVSASVEIQNTDPHNVTFDEIWFSGLERDTEFTPSSGTSYRVNASVTVVDFNGYQDIDVVWAAWFYGSNVSECDHIDEDDFDVCYRNVSCSVISGSGSGNKQSYHCDFGLVKYYADYGSWNLTVYANDTAGDVNITNYTQITINSLKSLTTASTINFGSRSPGDIVDASIDQLIENTGNNDLYVTVLADSNMVCTGRGFIPVGSIKYDTDAVSGDNTAYSLACGNLTLTDSWDCDTLTVFDEEDPTELNHIRTTYWGIQVAEGVSGTCSNTITFTAN